MDSGGIVVKCAHSLERVDWQRRRGRRGERRGERERERESECVTGRRGERAGACGKVGVACGEVYGLY